MKHIFYSANIASSLSSQPNYFSSFSNMVLNTEFTKGGKTKCKGNNHNYHKGPSNHMRITLISA